MNKFSALQKKVDEKAQAIKTVSSKLNSQPNYEIPSDVVTEAVLETQLIERKKLNVVIFGLGPVSGTEDKEVFVNLCSEKLPFNREDLVEGISGCERIGRENSPRPRPLLIKLKSTELKRKLLASAKNLKNYNNSIKPLPPVIIAPDLTRRQQEGQKKLRDELKRRKNNNENVTIRNGRIDAVQDPISNSQTSSS